MGTGSKPGCPLRKRKRAPTVMRTIGKTRETLLGLPSWAMAHLRYVVLRTRKENSSASGWIHCTTRERRPGNQRHEEPVCFLTESESSMGLRWGLLSPGHYVRWQSRRGNGEERCVVKFG